MSKKKRYIIVTLFLFIVSGTFFVSYFFISKSQQFEEKMEMKDIHYVANRYQLDYVYDTNENNDPFIFIATSGTEGILARWRNVSDKFSVIEYPEKAIKEGDWLTVNEVFVSNYSNFDEVLTDMYDEATGVSVSQLGDEVVNESLLRRYILYRNTDDETFMKVLIDLKFEEPHNG
ncbi:hypothetical protein HXA33_16440 [Salipaludibacillus agaradhaerens]|jgi:hypothetical protein|uniref:Uncharacterized protein n=2 Tax=Salipaludibacillus agaradhaerens TaxID=76935 RepID=A0A9Q4FYW8_SALAG|nr:hypothetical protein [Salipaludibacillus agaradhaerens]